MTSESQTLQLMDGTAHFVAGWLSGCGGVLASHPLDTVKVRLQTQGVVVTGHMYAGTWECVRHTVQREGTRGLFKGMSPPLLLTAIWNGVAFGVYGNTLTYLAGDDTAKQHEMKNVFVASIAAGVAQTFIICPLELTKSRLQIQSCQTSTRYSGLTDCVVKIYREKGVRGLFNGYQGCFIRDMIGFPTYFCSFELLSRLVMGQEPQDAEMGPVALLVAGGCAGSFSWACAFPPDVFKCRLQVDYERKYSGFVHCIRKSVKEEGWALMRRGFMPTILRAFPMNAAIFSIYYSFIRAYEGWRFG